jgi:hypothetical protein
LAGIELQTLGCVPRDEIRMVAAGFALDWAARIEAGEKERDVLPKNGIVNWISRSFNYKKLENEVNDVRKERARQSSRHVPREQGESFDDMNRKLIAEIEAGK